MWRYNSLIRAKYRRACHFLEARWALEDLRKRRIKISIFDGVNDSRELRAYCFRGLEPATEDLVQLITSKYCLLCFGLDPDDEYMWQEYGDRGKGICFVMDVRNTMLSQVKYVSELEVADLPSRLVAKLIEEHRPYLHRGPTPGEKRGMDYIRRILLTKFDEWKREREWRVFLRRDEEENGFYFAKLSTQGMFLEEVILGRDCDVSDDEVGELVRDYPRGPIVVRRRAQDIQTEASERVKPDWSAIRNCNLHK